MGFINGIYAYFLAHGVELVAIGWALEKLLELVSTVTPWKWDDNLGVILGNFLRKITGKGPAS